MESVKEERDKFKICSHCNKAINLNKDKYVLLSTYNHGKAVENVYMHFNCWLDYFNKCVLNKAKANVMKARDNMMQMISNNPVISSMIKNIDGGEQVMKMVNLPLKEEEIIDINKVKEKLNNGRKKRAFKRQQEKD